MSGDVMSTDEVAALLGIDREAVRSTMRRYGIPHGWPRADVEALKARGYGQGQGRRTDLRHPD
jgi:hypothetical protein